MDASNLQHTQPYTHEHIIYLPFAKIANSYRLPSAPVLHQIPRCKFAAQQHHM